MPARGSLERSSSKAGSACDTHPHIPFHKGPGRATQVTGQTPKTGGALHQRTLAERLAREQGCRVSWGLVLSSLLLGISPEVSREGRLEAGEGVVIVLHKQACCKYSRGGLERPPDKKKNGVKGVGRVLQAALATPQQTFEPLMTCLNESRDAIRSRGGANTDF